MHIAVGQQPTGAAAWLSFVSAAHRNPVIVVIAYWLSRPVVHTCRRQLATLPSVVVQTVGRSCKVRCYDWKAAGYEGPPPASKFFNLEEGFQRAMEVCAFSAAWSPLLAYFRAQGPKVWCIL